jgi:hypothetical protein
VPAPTAYTNAQQYPEYDYGEVYGTYAAYAISSDEIKYADCQVWLQKHQDDHPRGYKDYETAYRRKPGKMNEVPLLRPDTLHNDVVVLIGSSASAEYVARSLDAFGRSIQTHGLFIGRNDDEYVFEHFGRRMDYQKIGKFPSLKEYASHHAPAAL